MLKHKLISVRFYGGSVQGQFSLSAVVQSGASIMRKMGREVLCSNPGPDRKSVRTEINSCPIIWGSVQGQFSLSAVVQPGASIMRKMGREVLCSNLGPDKKSVRT